VPACWAATRLGGRQTKLDLKLGAILNTVQGSLLPTHHVHIQTHTHTQGCAMGPPMWPWHCGLIARTVSGVEWSGVAPDTKGWENFSPTTKNWGGVPPWGYKKLDIMTHYHL